MKKICLGLFLLLSGLYPATPQQLVLLSSGNEAARTFFGDFTQPPPLDSRLVFTRASIGWDCNDGAGSLASFAVNVPMEPVYSLCGSDVSGMGIWPARTNSLLNSQSPATQTDSLILGTYYVWIKGSGSLAISGTGLTFVAGSATVTAASPAQFFISGTTSVTFTVSGSVTFEQAERVSGVSTTGNSSPPIVTAGAPVARSTDSLSLPLSTVGLNAVSGTVVAGIFIPDTNGGAPDTGSQYIIFVNDGTASNNGYAVYVSPSSGNASLVCFQNGVALSIIPSGFHITPGALHNVGLAYDGTGASVSVDGAFPVNLTYACPYVGSFSSIQFGGSTSGIQRLSGYIKSVSTYNGRLEGNFLQAATSILPPLNHAYTYMGTMGYSNSDGAHSIQVLTTDPPYPNQAYMLNDYWGVRGAGPALPTLFHPGITGLIPAFETNGPNPPISVAQAYGETNVTGQIAQQVFQGSLSRYIGRSDGSPGKVLAQLLGTSAVHVPLNFCDTANCANSTVNIPSWGDVNGTTSVTNVAPLAGIHTGLYVSGAHIPTGASVVGQSSSTLTLSAATINSRPYANHLYEVGGISGLILGASGTIHEPGVALIEGLNDGLDGTTYDQYCGNLATLISSLNTDIKAITSQVDDVLLFQMQLTASSTGVSFPQINQCQLDISLTNSLIRLAAPSYFLTYSPGFGPHFDARSQRLQGEYLGKAQFWEFKTPGTHWWPLYPTSIAFNTGDKSKIEVTLHVPVGNVVKDANTSHMPQGQAINDGFVYHDACSANQISSVSVVSPTVVEIQLNTSHICANPVLNYAIDTMTPPGPYQGSSWGNIRDEDTTAGWAGEVLYNWLVNFSESVSG